MERTLHGCAGCDGDRVLVDKFVLDFRDPLPGDVVVFHGPDSWSDNGAEVADSNALARAAQHLGSLVGIAPPNGNDFVKRVIAIGGQTIRCCDERGRVLVDDKPLDEPYIYWEGGTPSGDQEFDAVLVPEGTIWVMGDNRANSCDSRCQGGGGIRGVVPLGKIIGKARTIVLPPARWQGVGDHNPQGDAEASASGAPTWQQGLPLGAGLLLAGPTFLGWRRLRPWRPRRRRGGE
jgi:signal peptidase I